MKQKYEELTHDICVRAVLECFNGKWKRQDVLEVIEKYAGIPRRDILAETKSQEMWLRLEAAESIAYELEQRIDDLMNGEADDLDLDPVVIRPRPDGMTGKIRDIAQCSVMHQIFGHLLFLGLKPFLMAKILPQQYASIPGRGQTGLARKNKRYLRSRKYGITVVRKTDVHHAYGSTQYYSVIALIRKKLPNAKWIISVLTALGRIAPDGHLIIGGYVDAWLFNLVMSFALRHVLKLHTNRRIKKMYFVMAVLSYMDDSVLMGRRSASIKLAVRYMNEYLLANFGLELKSSNKESKLFTVEQERDMRKRGCRAKPPGVDIGGYVVHRTYTSIRPGIFRRIRRQFLRAARQVEGTGTIMLCRSRKLIAYFGYFKNSNTRHARENLNVDYLMVIARRVVSAHSYLDAIKKGLVQNA